MERNVVFDLDDTLWPLNKVACRLLNIDFSKINCFVASENKLLTDDEKYRLMSLYSDPELWKHISWYSGYKTLMEGQCVEFTLLDTSKGYQATNVSVVNDEIIV